MNLSDRSLARRVERSALSALAQGGQHRLYDIAR